MAQYAVIADDLTGALDAGAGFARAGLRVSYPVSSVPADAPDADVLLINTGSRDGSADLAAMGLSMLAQWLKRAGVERVYKKIDSVLRGHPGVELAALLDVFGGRALVAPAFPAQGRTTRHGVQYAHGTPVQPYGGRLREALSATAPRIDLHDAATDEDLARIARQAAANPEYRVWCGSAGLAAHVPAALGLRPAAGPPLPTLPRADRILVIAGSRHPATVAQSTFLRDAGWASVVALAMAPARGDVGTGTVRSAALELIGAADLGHAQEGPASPNGTARVVLEEGELVPDEGDVGLRTWLEQALWSQTPPGDDADPGRARGRAIVTIGLVESGSPDQRADPEWQLRDALWMLGHSIPIRPGLGFIMTGGDTADGLCEGIHARAIHVVGEALPGVPVGVLELRRGMFPIATKSGGFGGPDALAMTAEVLLGRPV